MSSPGIAREDGRKRPNVPAISARRALCNPHRDGRNKSGQDSKKQREGTMMQIFKSAGLAVLTIWLAFAAGSACAQDAASGAWTKKAPMRHARSELQAAAVNGKIYVIGGGYIETKDGKPVDNITSGYTE